MKYFHLDIDPVLIRIGNLQVRWYSVLYVGGYLAARLMAVRLAREDRFRFTAVDMQHLALWLLIGAVVGARVVYCVVYDPRHLAANPLYLFQIRRGGLSFHGGLLGAVMVAILFARQRRIPIWNLLDAMALATPICLAFGRLGNFMNGELWGRVSYVPWAIVFRDGGPEPRHPSQLYELFLEGIVLLGLLLWVKGRSERDGVIALTFGIGYGVCRFVVEFFREPDAHIGYVFAGLTMGQILSIAQLAVVAILGVVLFSPRASPVPQRR